jgi:hypothetical protein
MARKTKRGSISAFTTVSRLSSDTATVARSTFMRGVDITPPVQELWKLSDRELADLRITRKDIARLAWK